MLVTSARTYAAFEIVHKDGLKRRLHLLIRRKRGQLCDDNHKKITLQGKAYQCDSSTQLPALTNHSRRRSEGGINKS